MRGNCPTCGLLVEHFTPTYEAGVEWIDPLVPQIRYRDTDRVKYYTLKPCGHLVARIEMHVDGDGHATYTYEAAP